MCLIALYVRLAYLFAFGMCDTSSKTLVVKTLVVKTLTTINTTIITTIITTHEPPRDDDRV